jgi:hypothetical protein
MKDRSGDPLLWWLVVISVGCLLMALVCAATLSRLTSVPITRSSATSIGQQTDGRAGVSTLCQIGEGGQTGVGDVAPLGTPNPCALVHAPTAWLLTSARGAA